MRGGRRRVDSRFPKHCRYNTGNSPPKTVYAHRFFANLLPEAGVRERTVRDLKIPNTDFDLLRAIGGECAGALSVLRAEQQPSTEYLYHRITEEELLGLARRRGRVHAWADSERPRLSLAGAQGQMPGVGGRRWVLAAEERISIQPHSQVSNYPTIGTCPPTRTFATLLAGAIGLPVVDIRLRSIAGTRYASIERFDRQRSENGGIARLHQEDFCQALGFGHERKYQEGRRPDVLRLFAG